MNHGQFTPFASTGLTMPMTLKLTPVHNSGISRPPQASGRGMSGSVGSSTPYISPNTTELTA